MTKVSIDIGISALNEEANISTLLQSINSQAQDSYRINAVYLVSDGSTDRTVQRAREVKLNGLKIIEHAERSGKTKRMDEITKYATSNILVLLDADIALESPATIGSLVAPIIDREASLTSGMPKKINTGTFIDKVMDVSQFLQDEIKSNFKRGDSVYACHGRIVALHKQLFDRLRIPYSSVGNDAYLYFFNKSLGYKFKFVDDAIVNYKAPQSLKDFMSQQHRFASTPQELSNYFGSTIPSEYKIPKLLTINTLLKAALKFPLYLPCYIFMRIYALCSPKGDAHVKWSVSESTKSL